MKFNIYKIVVILIYNYNFITEQTVVFQVTALGSQWGKWHSEHLHKASYSGSALCWAEHTSSKICCQSKKGLDFVQILQKMNAAIIHRWENTGTGHCDVGREMRTGGRSHAERWRALHVGGHQ